MPDHLIEISPRDELIFRDARPFTADPGAFAHSLPFPMPHTVAGAVRSHLIRNRPGFNGWNPKESDHAQAIDVSGSLLVSTADDGTSSVYVPAPSDAVVFVNDAVAPDHADRFQAMRLTPDLEALDSTTRGCTMPGTGIAPLQVGRDEKAYGKLVWWTLKRAARWLQAPPGGIESIALADTREQIKTSTRVHVSIKPDTQTHAEGALFGTEALAFPEGLSIICRTSGDIGPPVAALGPFGGERRLALFQPWIDSWPGFIEIGGQKLTDRTTRLRLQLVTPALFAGGWDPGDITASINKLTESQETWSIVSVACGRRVPVSGWDMAANNGRGQQKPLRYAVPAGSVYFLESSKAVDTKPLLEKLWLKTIGDDIRNGYGLVLPGIW